MPKKIISITKNYKQDNAVTTTTLDTDAIQKKLSWYESFFNNASDALFIIQPETWNVLDANEYAATLFDMRSDELIGSTIPQFRRIFKLLEKTTSPQVLSELSLITSTGKELMVEVSAKFIKIDDDMLIQAIARDVSEQHAMTDKLVQADKLVLLGQLTAGISHDIRNPLAAINLNLQMLQRNISADSPDHSYIENALLGVERIHKIIETSLSFAKQAVIEVSRININSLVPTILELTATSIKKKNILVKLDLDENINDINADVKQLYQVFINLITNASDAMKEGGIIIIKTFNEMPHKSGERAFVVISIQDTGCGINEEDLSKIFTPFFTRKPDGTGLGLPISQRIIHQHGGIIDVESKLGIGTTFYVKLPIII
jgi:PAS domain S-box-containing protein